MAFSSFGASIAPRHGEENLKFAKPAIAHSDAVERFVMVAIRLFDGCGREIPRRLARRA
jgi:hypothetical protein